MLGPFEQSPTNLKKSFDVLDIRKIKTVQNPALIISAWILRRNLQLSGNLVSLIIFELLKNLRLKCQFD